MSTPKQIPLNTLKIHECNLTPSQMKQLLLKVKKRGLKILKVNIIKSTPDRNANGGAGQG